MWDNILEKNKESQTAAVQGYQTIFDALSRRMDTDEDWKPIAEEMIAVANKIAELDLNNKKFLDRINTKMLCGILGFAAIVGAAIGINSAFDGDEELPQLTYNNENIL